MITLQKINQLLGNFATQHLQISSYFFGDFTKHREGNISYPLLIGNPSLVATSTNSTTYTLYIWVLDRFQNGFINEPDVYNDTALILQDLKAYFQNNTVVELILEDEVTFEKISDEVNSDLVGGWVGTFRIRVPFSDDLCTIPGIGSGIAYSDSYRVVSVGAGSSGTSGTSGISGSSGTSGINGQNGISTSLFYYQAKTNTTSGDPSNGHISWNNTTQSASTQLQISHLTDLNVTDIDIFLTLLSTGSRLVIQDRNNSDNSQVWIVSGTPVKVGSTYWNVPVTLISSNYSFSNNQDIFLATVAPSGSSGTSGSSGISGINGIDGSLSSRWIYSPTYTTTPASGRITAQGSYYFSLNAISISEANYLGSDYKDFLTEVYSWFSDGKDVFIQFTKVSDNSKFLIYKLTNVSSSSYAWVYTSPTFIAGNEMFISGQTYTVSFNANGKQGIQGIQGAQGNAGVAGLDGSNAIRWQFLRESGTPSSTGVINSDNEIDTAAITILNISYTPENSPDAFPWLDALRQRVGNGYPTFLKITDVDKPSVLTVYEVTAVYDDSLNSFFEVDVTYLAGGGELQDTDIVSVSWNFNGRDGAAGADGANGTSGSSGTSGTSGSSGISGLAGSSGTSGISNIGIFSKSVNNINGLGERWFSTWVTQPSSLSSRATEADTLYLVPMQVERGYTLDRIGIYVSITGSTATKSCRLGIYNSSISGTPSTLNTDFGTVSVSTLGTQAITINKNLSAGLYFFAIHTDSNATLLSTPTTSLYPHLGGITSAGALQFTSVLSLSRTYSLGLPTDTSSMTWTVASNVVQYTPLFRISNITS